MVSATGKICAETVSVVSHCPIANEYHSVASQRCVGVCGDSEGRYKYHCMRDSSKTVLMEMCAIPKRLFELSKESLMGTNDSHIVLEK
uniref:Uncharacterized protein n=1 Tax=Magallana gigas TaxID=29159 RepID=A0A8W8JAQ4_MAGGI